MLLIATVANARGDEDFPFACAVNDTGDARYYIGKDRYDFLHEVNILRGTEVITTIPLRTTATDDNRFYKFTGESIDGLVAYRFEAYIAKDDSGQDWIRYRHAPAFGVSLPLSFADRELRRATCVSVAN